MEPINKVRADLLLKSFLNEDQSIEKGESELDLLEKAGPRAVIGETRMFGGRQYIKTAEGWKFHGKGTGAAAQSHIINAGLHHLNNAVASNKPVDAAAKHDHSDKKFEDAPEGHKHQVGDAVKVQNGIRDPRGKQGSTGTVVHSDNDTANVRFSDGVLGQYNHDTLKKQKSEVAVPPAAVEAPVQSTAELLFNRKLDRISHEITHYFHPGTGEEKYKSFSGYEQLQKLKESGLFKDIIDGPEMQSIADSQMRRLSAMPNRSEVYKNLKDTYDAKLAELGVDKKVGVSISALNTMEAPTIRFEKPKEMVQVANKLSKDFYVQPFHNYTSCYLRIFKK